MATVVDLKPHSCVKALAAACILLIRTGLRMGDSVLWRKFDAWSDKFGMPEFNAQVDLLHRMIDVAQTRHQAISHNLANVNTPGYQRLEVAFEDSLRTELNSADSNAGHRAQPTVYRQSNLPERADGNNVDIDQEVGELNRNTLMYQTYIQLLTTQFTQMRSAIRS